MTTSQMADFWCKHCGHLLAQINKGAITRTITLHCGACHADRAIYAPKELCCAKPATQTASPQTGVVSASVLLDGVYLKEA